MFDIAYEHEATIEAVKLIKEKNWNEIMKLDLTKPLAGFIQMLEITKLEEISKHHEILFLTHGE